MKGVSQVNCVFKEIEVMVLSKYMRRSNNGYSRIRPRSSGFRSLLHEMFESKTVVRHWPKTLNYTYILVYTLSYGRFLATEDHSVIKKQNSVRYLQNYITALGHQCQYWVRKGFSTTSQNRSVNTMRWRDRKTACCYVIRTFERFKEGTQISKVKFHSASDYVYFQECLTH